MNVTVGKRFEFSPWNICPQGNFRLMEAPGGSASGFAPAALAFPAWGQALSKRMREDEGGSPPRAQYENIHNIREDRF
jgi:hypothetical protein